MAAILGDSAVVVVVVRTRPWAMPLVMITMRTSTHGFPFLSYMSMELLLAVLRAVATPLWFPCELSPYNFFQDELSPHCTVEWWTLTQLLFPHGELSPNRSIFIVNSPPTALFQGEPSPHCSFFFLFFPFMVRSNPNIIFPVNTHPMALLVVMVVVIFLGEHSPTGKLSPLDVP